MNLPTTKKHLAVLRRRPSKKSRSRSPHCFQGRKFSWISSFFRMGSTLDQYSSEYSCYHLPIIGSFQKKSAALSSTRCPFDSVPAVRLWDGGHVSQQLWKQSLSATFRGHWANTLAGCTRSQPARITGRKILWLFEREVITLPPIIMKS